MYNLSDEDKEYLKSYNANEYDRPSFGVDVLIFTIRNEMEKNYRKLPEKKLRILLTKRGIPPQVGYWSLPGTFIKLDEELEECAIRALKEKTNVDNLYLEQLYTFGEVNRDPRTRLITCSYMALVDSSNIKLMAGGGRLDASWFAIDTKVLAEDKIENENGYVITEKSEIILTNESTKLSAVIETTTTVNGKNKKVSHEIISSENIAFDHAKIILYAINRLKNKVEYTDIAFNLMPEYFSLTELQNVYEIILGTELLKANFRRKISNMVIPTDIVSDARGHRPSKLFKFNNNWKNTGFVE